MGTPYAARADVRLWISPLDSQAAYHTPCALNVSMASLMAPDNGDTAGSGITAFETQEWQGQKGLLSAQGPLQFVRFLPDGRVSFATRSAVEARPEREVCGFTVRPRTTRLQGFVAGGSSNLSPGLPEGQPVLEWVTQQGDSWEHVAPARVPFHSGLRSRSAPAGKTVKAKTKLSWAENAPLGLTFDLKGTASGHQGEPAIRFEWGGRFSLVLRGLGNAARPTLERRGADENGAVDWKVWRALDGAPAMTDSFWHSRHEVLLFRLSGFLIVSWNGVYFAVGEVDGDDLRPVTWKAAPLRLSVYGCDLLLQASALDFSAPARFASQTTVDAAPLAPVTFELGGAKVHDVDTGTGTGSGTGGGRVKLHGSDLELTQVKGQWSSQGSSGLVQYEVMLQGTAETPPLLCSLAAQLPAALGSSGPGPINFRAALQELEVESGEPEVLPSAEANFSLSVPLLDQFVPEWRTAVLPFRPVHIEVDPNNDGQWETLFRGYLLPQGTSSNGYGTEHITLLARDPKIRLREPAALVDGRFGPLDLMPEATGGNLFGAQCVQKLIGLEMGDQWAQSFNGTGDPFIYYESDHYPLLSGFGENYFHNTQMPPSGNFYLPPPVGEDIERWIDKIREFDNAVWFYDPREGPSGGWVYGDINRFYALRGHTVHELQEGTGEMTGDSLADWPLLSAYNAQSLLEKAYTRVRVWGAPPQDAAARYRPSLYIGAAGQTQELNSADPFHESQSWPRTLLVRQEFIGQTAPPEIAESLAWRIWGEFEGRAPQRWDFTLQDQILTARWGELVLFRTQQLRIVRTKHQFAFDGSGGRTTEITARSLSARGV